MAESQVLQLKDPRLGLELCFGVAATPPAAPAVGGTWLLRPGN